MAWTNLKDLFVTRNEWDSVSQAPIYLLNNNSGEKVVYAKYGNVVVVQCNGLYVTQRTSRHIGRLPDGYKPIIDAVGHGYVRGDTSSGQIDVSSIDGMVNVWCDKSTNGYFAGSVAYIVP